MSLNRFKTILDFTLKWECVYDRNGKVRAEFDPDDPGGLTKYGIDQRSHPKLDIRNLTYEQAYEVYFKEYWLKNQCDKMGPGFGEACFDMCVNQGSKQAGRHMQRGMSPIYTGKVDGDIGPLTVGATNEASATHLKKILLDRDAFYYRLAGWEQNEEGKWYQKESKKANKFLKGWLNRNRDLKRMLAVN